MTTGATATVERELRIAARPQIVFELLTDASQLLRWQGVDADLDAQPGGVYRVTVNRLGHTTAGRFVEVVPYSRIVFSWGWETPIFPIPPGSTTVEIDLEADGDGTLLRLRHTGLPAVPEVLVGHGAGWTHNLERLVVLAEGGVPDPHDPWLDGQMSS